MRDRYLSGRGIMVALMLSASLNLFLLGGVTSYIVFGSRGTELAPPPPPPGGELPPPVRLFQHLMDYAYPNLSEDGKIQAGRILERLRDRMRDRRPDFHRDRQLLREIMTGEEVDMARLEDQLGRMLAKRNELDPILIESIKAVAQTMSVEDRRALAEAVEDIFRRRPGGPMGPMAPRS